MSDSPSIPVSGGEMTMIVQSLMAIMEATSMALECDPKNKDARGEFKMARNLLMKIVIRVIKHSNESKNSLTLPVETNPELN